MQIVKKSSYRQRVYADSQGNILLVFGNDPAPMDPVTNVAQKLLADHDIEDTATVTDHVDAVVAQGAD